jgi:glycine/D-amino acid oxidase-like deaminating enzyme
VRIAIVGGGIAGALLGWRLNQAAPGLGLDIFAGTPTAGTPTAGNPTAGNPTAGNPTAGNPTAGTTTAGTTTAGMDATAASGGLVRGFEAGSAVCRSAAESLAEIRSSATLSEWAGYREIGSVYLLPPGADPEASMATVDRLLPGSATVAGRTELAGYPFRGLPAGALGVVERYAGFISPDRLRATVLAELAGAGASIRCTPAVAVTPDPAVRLADGSTVDYDAVVVAAGAWTPGLLAGSGLATAGLRTKMIQYTVCAARLPRLGAFVDDITGLYGRPVDRDSFLLGLPADRWDVHPAAVVPDRDLVGRVAACALSRFGSPVRPVRTVASFDCFHDPPGLALRRSAPGSALFTFTGGSGGAAKTAIAASRAAARALLTS